jgi:hypothetical protein
MQALLRTKLVNVHVVRIPTKSAYRYPPSVRLDKDFKQIRDPAKNLPSNENSTKARNFKTKFLNYNFFPAPESVLQFSGRNKKLLHV